MLYFSYGSNMSIDRLLKRGITSVKLVGVGHIDHWQFQFNKKSQKDPKIGFANIEPFWEDRVYGSSEITYFLRVKSHFLDDQI